MHQPSLSRDEVREVDRVAIEEFELPGVVLMENAGRGTVDVLLEHAVRGRVVVCCGKGNNGGDGFVIARHLENRGCDVRVLLFADPGELTADAAINRRVLQHAGTPVRVFAGSVEPRELDAEFQAAGWIVDALLGTGVQGRVRAPFDTVIDRINAARAKVLAVDLPSGLDCDTGEPLGACVQAELTATFVARKQGFDNPEADEFTGEVHVVDIGVPRRVLERQMRPLDE